MRFVTMVHYSFTEYKLTKMKQHLSGNSESNTHYQGERNIYKLDRIRGQILSLRCLKFLLVQKLKWKK